MKIRQIMPKWASSKNKQKIMGPAGYTTTSAGFFGNLGYQNGSFDNTYPSIARIADAMSEVMPYAVDANNERMKEQPQVIRALYSPNRQMSGVGFIETLATMALVHPIVYVLCWHQDGRTAIPGGPITPQNIAGFTFLERPGVVIDPATGVKTYRQGTQQWTDQEVIEISLSVNPYDILAGYSPSVAAKKWSTVDDYVADYQKGFFKNGAVPAGEFIITAATIDEYEEIVRELQTRHRGAGANNNVTYVHRPIGYDGTVVNAQIEWVPFAQSNKDITLAPIFEQANKKIDLAFGVPQEVKGYLTNSNYASVEVADYVFSRRVVYPKLVKMWSQFTHEMNRITGGLGCAISFDYEPPVLVETRKTQLQNLLSAVNAGYTLESAVDALQLPKSFLKLSTGENQVEDERMDATEDEPSEVTQVETSTKTVKAKAVRGEGDDLVRAAQESMQEQIDAAKEGKEVDLAEQAKKFAAKLLPLILTIALLAGEEQNAAGKEQLAQAGYDTAELPDYEVSEGFRNSYTEYLNRVALSYTEDTNDAIKQVLEQSEFEGWSYEETRARLDDLMDTQYWRVERLTRTERHRAEQYGSWDAMKALASQSGANIVKIWHVNPGSPNPCEICLGLDGKRLPLGEDFDDFPAGADEVADAHPNCVLGDTVINADGAQIATRYNYSGEVVKLTTAGGRRLTVTPNHILMTDKGWMRAKKLTKGVKVIAYSRSAEAAISGANPAKHDNKATISEIFSSLWESGKMSTTTMPMSTVDFKGDGIANEKINIVFANRLLRDESGASTVEFGGDLNFVGAGDFAEPLNGFSSLDQTLVGLLASSRGFIGSESIRLALLGSKSAHPDECGFLVTSDYDTRINETLMDRCPTDTEAIRNSRLAETGMIEFDDIVDIEIDSIHNAPVFDLQTSSTMYIANGIVSSNCSCYLTYEIVQKEKITRVICPKCGRYLCESSGGDMKGLKCHGCKGRFNFTIEKGDVKAEEVTND